MDNKPRQPLTYREIATHSYLLLKEAEYTTNCYFRLYIHRKIPNIPVARVVMAAKVTGLLISGAIAINAYNSRNRTLSSR